MPNPVSVTVHVLPLLELRRFSSSSDMTGSAPQRAQRMTPSSNAAYVWSGARSGWLMLASYWPAPVVHGGAPLSWPGTWATRAAGSLSGAPVALGGLVAVDGRGGRVVELRGRVVEVARVASRVPVPELHAPNVTSATDATAAPKIRWHVGMTPEYTPLTAEPFGSSLGRPDRQLWRASAFDDRTNLTFQVARHGHIETLFETSASAEITAHGITKCDWT